MATAHPTNSAHHHAAKFTNRQRTIALIIVALAFVMDLLDNTIVNIAIPSIQTDLGTSYSAIQWLTAGYALSFAVLLITGGRMGDVFGYKKLFMIGIIGFTVASLLCGIAWNSEILIGSRLFQGAMAALMVPQVMSLMQVMYKPKERGVVMGLFGAMAGLAASLGPVVGGILIELNIAGLDWRPIFLINIPLGIIAILGAIRFLPNGKSSHPLKLDIVGTGLIIAALGLLIFPLIEGRELDWPTWIFGLMIASIPLFLIFGWWQVKKDSIDKSPLILPALLKVKTFVTGILANLVFQMLMLGFFFTFTLVLQIGLGYDVLKAALTGIPTAIGISFSIGFLTQKLVPLLGRYTMTLGTVVLALGLLITFWVFDQNGLNTAPLQLTPGLLVIGTGMGMVMGLIFSVALKDVDNQHAGSASGTLNAVQQLGGAIGIAAIGVIFFGQLTTNASASFDAATPDIRHSLTHAGLPTQAQDQIIAGVKTCYIDRSKQKDASATPESCKTIQNQTGPSTPVSKAINESVTSAAKQANADNFVSGFGKGVIYAIALLVVSFGLSFLLPRRVTYDMGTH
ncbi:MAG: MFS transporter [Candidatus Saccharibacteria bacterium]